MLLPTRSEIRTLRGFFCGPRSPRVSRNARVTFKFSLCLRSCLERAIGAKTVKRLTAATVAFKFVEKRFRPRIWRDRAKRRQQCARRSRSRCLLRHARSQATRDCRRRFAGPKIRSAWRRFLSPQPCASAHRYTAEPRRDLTAYTLLHPIRLLLALLARGSARFASCLSG